jgi:nibrin
MEDVPPSQASRGAGSVGNSQMSGQISNRTRSHKRHSPEADAMDQDLLADQLAPAAAAMKRRRLEVGQESSSAQASGEDSHPKKGKAVEALEKLRRTQKQKEKEIDVKGVLRADQEAREEAERREAEANDDKLAPEEILRLKNLVVVEEMDVPLRQNPLARRAAAQNDRWEERWNGRKNFKRFRKQGTAASMRGHRVFVPLEEAKKKDYGIGDEYWLEPSDNSEKRTQDTARSQRRVIEETPLQEDSGDVSFRRQRGTQSLILVEDSEQNDGGPEMVPGTMESGRAERESEQTNEIDASRQDARSQTVVGDTQGNAASTRGKRPGASAPDSSQPQPKRPRRTAAARLQNDDDDDDEHAFRFTRRRR